MQTKFMQRPAPGTYFESEKDLANPEYQPAAFLSSIRSRLNLKNDAQLAIQLDVVPPVISKIRNRVQPVTPSILLRISEATGLTPQYLRTMLYI